jgi:hypothetical protein
VLIAAFNQLTEHTRIMASNIVPSNPINSQSDFIRYIQDNSIGGRNLSIRGLAGLCGVDDKAILNGADFKSQSLAQKLTASGFEGADFALTGFCAQSAWLVIGRLGKNPVVHDGFAGANAVKLYALKNSTCILTCFKL